MSTNPKPGSPGVYFNYIVTFHFCNRTEAFIFTAFVSYLGNNVATWEQGYKCTNSGALTFPSLCIALGKSARSASQITCESHLPVKHIIFSAGFLVVESHLETTLGSHHHHSLAPVSRMLKSHRPFTRHQSRGGDIQGQFQAPAGDQSLCITPLL